ncbi:MULTISPECIES: serine/threonine-protein kinase [Streptomyces]|jgi:serine/threonine protein kinase|uniref:non-specific serine/threonine protein kinase n=1 Tax=Streptomyces eurythermus TaxID=42237 RepID=A0ABW6Z6V9_9ACTN|nr:MULTISPECIES: serine/threonine-protein kinase [Streptomyces]QIS70816.1 serine/threonine protein kinase [Streptomyces sp. DSM 40868]
MRDYRMTPGELIDGRYELAELLGRGGMGEVWAAYDQRLDRSVAVKLLTPPTVSGVPRQLDPQDPAVIRFTREARLMAKLEHPYVPVIHDAGTHRASRLYLVMQRVYGHTLDRLVLQRGRFPVEWAAAVGAQVCSVLEQAHGRGFVHRDLTPRNVMLTADGTVRVLDFGIATALQGPDGPRLTGAGTVAGTPGFISPEQGKGQAATPLSDLYALGCVLYEILGGRPPFTAHEPLALVVQHIVDDPVPLDRLRGDVPAELCDLVSRLLAKRPEERLANAAEVRDVLAPWAEQAVPRTIRAAAPRPGSVTARVPQGGAGLPGRLFPGQEHRPSPEQAPASPPAAQSPSRPRRSSSPSGTGSSTPVDPGDLRERARRLAAEGRLSQALELLSRDLDAVLPRFGPADPEVVSRRLGILRLQFEAQELHAARDGCLELADILASTRPAPDADLAVCRVMAARCLGRLGHNSDALREFRSALDLQKTVFPLLHPEILGTRREIATLLAGSGAPGEALDALRSLADDQRTALPPDDPAHAEVERLVNRLTRLPRAVPLTQ